MKIFQNSSNQMNVFNGKKEKNNKYTLCHVGSIYSLFLYIVYANDETLRNTFYVFECYIPKQIAKSFNNYCYVAWNKRLFGKQIFGHWCFSWLYFRYLKLFKLPSNKNIISIYANDHCPSSATLIGHSPYILIEDSVNVCSRYWRSYRKQQLDRERNKLLYKLKKILFGPMYLKQNGDNEFCQGFVLSTDDNAAYIGNRKKYIVMYQNQWNFFSSFKKELIKRVYDLDDNDISLLAKKKVILFTQPLYPDFISKEEHKRIYSSIITKYNYSSDEFIVKPHPRDEYRYEEDFKDICVFRKKIPSQILQLFGIRFERAITVFSTAVCNFDYNLSIDWYGTTVNDDIYRKVGDSVPPPDGVKLCKIS